MKQTPEDKLREAAEKLFNEAVFEYEIQSFNPIEAAISLAKSEAARDY